MAATYTLISSNVLSSSAASVTFSAIPSTYTDLVLRVSARNDKTGNIQSEMYVTFNGTTSGYSYTSIRGNGATPVSNNGTAQASIGGNLFPVVDTADATANTFNSVEVYVPNYTVAQNKPIASFTALENNAITAWMYAGASLWSNTAAITSMTISNSSTWVFNAGSSFYLYGIKNS